MLKIKHIVATLTLVAASSSCMAITAAMAKDNLCLAYGSHAALVASLGLTLEENIALVDKSSLNSRMKRIQRSIAEYIYTMELSPVQARKIVYLKCMSGQYE